MKQPIHSWRWILGVPAGAARFARIGLDLLVVFNLVAQAATVLVVLMGPAGAQVAPVAGGATVALALLVYFYARWMFPFLKGWQLLAVILLKELGVIVLVSYAVGAVMTIRWLLG